MGDSEKHLRWYFYLLVIKKMKDYPSKSLLVISIDLVDQNHPKAKHPTREAASMIDVFMLLFPSL